MKKYRMYILALLFLLILFIIDIELGVNASKSSVSQFYSMLMIVPPIFVLIGLMDVWIPRETMIKLMGEKSGVIGLLIAFFFGTFAAGPLVAAFPLAYIMLKKGAKYSYVVFFLTIWASAKMPIIFFQATQMGIKFTVIMNVTLILVYLIGTMLIDSILGKKEINEIYKKSKAA